MPLDVAPVALEYVFAPQFMHTETPCCPENLPAPQSMHPDPAVAYLPAEHKPHPTALLTPVSAPVPAAQSRHMVLLVAFTAALQVPARHSKHPEPNVEYFPAPHTPHELSLLAPDAAPLPAGQPIHTALLVAFVVVENFPALQSMHPDPAVAYLPAEHTPHARRLAAPAVAPVPGAQSRHTPLFVAPVKTEYFPATQFSQVLAFAAENLPAPHVPQELAPVIRVPGQE